MRTVVATFPPRNGETPVYAQVHVPSAAAVTFSVIEASVGLVAFHESAGWPISRKPLTRAPAPHFQDPGTRAKPDCPS